MTETHNKIKHTIAVASGKGGVGKSTVAVNLALALVKEGYRVGLLDADIYGPSIPLMLGVDKEKPKVTKLEGKNKIIPVTRYSMKIMSIGFLTDENEAVIWRGPMAASALRQFITDVLWDELDFLIFDMPPGTGDIQLTLTQTLPLSGAVIVTTPQEIALIDARKGAKMFTRVNVPVLGIVENMSYFVMPDNSREYIFGQGGGRKLADELNIKFLGEIEINKIIMLRSDEGKPVVLSEPDSLAAQQFTAVAGNIADLLTGDYRINEPVIEI
jgi:ATP-binding protein involved in chromosome partitioning